MISCLAFAGSLALALWPIMPPPVVLGIVGGVLAFAAWLTTTIGKRMASRRP